MSTLKERVEECARRRPAITHADIARAAGIKQPSVTDWFNGKTTRLKLRTAVKAAELWGCNPLWLGEGEGLPQWQDEAGNPTPASSHTPTVALAEALPVVLRALAALPPARWISVRAQLDQVAGRPDMHDDVLTELQHLLATPGKQQSAA